MTRPSFENPLFNELYTRDFFIADEVLRDILALGPAAVPDLLKIANTALTDYDTGQLTRDSWLDTFYFDHALYLLDDLRAPEAFDVYRRLLRLDAEGTDYWFGDNLFEEVPTLLAHASQTRLPELLALLEDPQVLLMHRIAVSDAVTRLAQAQPALRPAVLTFLQQHLRRIIADPAQAHQQFPADAGTYHYALKDYLAGVLVDVQQAGIRELEPEVRQLHRLGLVDESMAGGEEDIDFDRLRSSQPGPDDIFARYQVLRDDPASYSPHHPDAAAIAQRRAEQEARYAQLRYQHQARQPQYAPPKIGRNDPCPCGSGKKYKKCHGA